MAQLDMTLEGSRSRARRRKGCTGKLPGIAPERFASRWNAGCVDASDVARAVPAYDEPLLAARGLQLAKPEGRSLEVLPEGVLRLRGPKGTWSVPAASVARIEINQFSPGRTAGLVVGAFFAEATLIAALITTIVVINDRPFEGLNLDMGGWGSMSRPHGAR